MREIRCCNLAILGPNGGSENLEEDSITYQSGLLAVGCGHSMTTSCVVVPSGVTAVVVVSLVSEILYKMKL